MIERRKIAGTPKLENFFKFHMSETNTRQPFGLEVLDNLLGGGLRPGTLTVIAGATGAGKTQLGLQWAARGSDAEGRRGAVLDLTSRGDSQNHAEYAQSRHRWPLREQPDWLFAPESSFREPPPDLLQPFHGIARRVTRPDMDPDAWDAWKRDLARVLRTSAGFLYSHLCAGAKRVVADGFEPVENAADSVQLELFEYLYAQVLRQEDAWAAREVLREKYREYEKDVRSHAYDSASVGCLALLTASEVSLDDMLAKPIGQGNLFATANTVILLGRVRKGDAYGRALCVMKHRGSASSDAIVPFTIDDGGIRF